MCFIILSWFLTSAGYGIIAVWTGLANMYLGMSDTCHKATGRIHSGRTFLGATHCKPSQLLRRSRCCRCQRDENTGRTPNLPIAIPVQVLWLGTGLGTPLLDLIWIALAIKVYLAARLWHAQGTRVRACQDLLLAHAEHHDRPNCWLRGYFCIPCVQFFYLFGNLQLFYSNCVGQRIFPKYT